MKRAHDGSFGMADQENTEPDAIKRAAKEKYVFNNEKTHHTNIQSAFDSSDSGRFNDVEFSLSDGSELKANKFILATQSEYFATMFYGSLKHEKTVPMKWCTKTTMEKILAFLSVGKVDIGDLDVMELLELMEAARLIFLEKLFNFVEEYVEQFVDSSSGIRIFSNEMALPPVQALVALDFALVKHFESVTTWLLKFIDRNINKFIFMKKVEAGVLSENGMTILLGYEGSAKRIDMLTFFAAWKEGGNDSQIEIAQYVKLKELNAQELKIAWASNLYSESEIIDNMERIVSDKETILQEANVKIGNQDRIIASKDAENSRIKNWMKKKVAELEKKNSETNNLLKEKDDEIENKNSEIENLKQSVYEKESEIARRNCYRCRNRRGESCGNRRKCNKCSSCRAGQACHSTIHGI